MRYRLIFSLAALLTAADQFTKWLTVNNLALHETVPITSFFNLVHVRNRGAAFGFLNDPDIFWQHWIFLGATLLACGIVFYIARSAKNEDKPLFFALGCIMGGAFGNMLDRLRLREVVDFLDIHIGDYHWPAFNVADIAICIGAGLIVLLMFKPPRSTARTS